MYVRTYVDICSIITFTYNITLSHIGSREITSIHKPCIPCTSFQYSSTISNVTREHGGLQVCIHYTLIQDYEVFV